MEATSLALSLATASLLVISIAHARRATGMLGAPDATTTIDGHYLPNPSPPQLTALDEQRLRDAAALTADSVAPAVTPTGEDIRRQEPSAK